MKYFKTSLIIGLIIVSVFIMPQQTHAQTLRCDDTSEVPFITTIICPTVRVLNVVILFSGVVFTLMVISAVYKYATSLGDPKAAMGAQATLTNAVLGFVIVIAFFSIFTIITGIFGLRNYASPNVFFGQIQCAIFRIFTCTSSGGPIIDNLPRPSGCDCAPPVGP